MNNKKEYFIDTPIRERSYEHREFMLAAGCLAKLIDRTIDLPVKPSQYVMDCALALLDQLEGMFEDPEEPSRCTSVRAEANWINKAKKMPLLYAGELLGLYQEGHPLWNFIPN
jgi:hypothetical protein